MKILVTGANGFVGTSLSHSLLQQGYELIKAVGAANQQYSASSYVEIGFIDAETDWQAALQGAEVVVHLAARVHVMQDKSINPLAEFRKVNVDGTLNLARQAAAAGIKRFIFISSVKVNGEISVLSKPFTTEDIANPQDAYGLSKYEAEQGLILIANKTGMELVIIRPPLVYGLGVKANFATMFQAVKLGIPLPFGAIRNRRSFVYVENLVSLILRCIIHPAANNQIFFVSDGHDLSTTELLQASAIAMGVKARLLPIPQKLLEVCATLAHKKDWAQRLCGNLQVDILKTCELLDWQPPFTVAEGLKITATGIMNEYKR